MLRSILPRSLWCKYSHSWSHDRMPPTSAKHRFISFGEAHPSAYLISRRAPASWTPATYYLITTLPTKNTNGHPAKKPPSSHHAQRPHCSKPANLSSYLLPCQSHMRTLIFHKLGFNQNYCTFTLILLKKIFLCGKFPRTKFINYEHFEMQSWGKREQTSNTSATSRNALIWHNESIQWF